MAYDYSGLIARADALIEKFGASGVLSKRSLSGSGYNPTVATSTYAVQVVRLAHRKAPKDSSSTKMTRSEVYISAASGIVPEIEDGLTFAGTEYEIREVEIISPSGVNVVYKAVIEI